MIEDPYQQNNQNPQNNPANNNRQSFLLDTTDCLEAVNVFRSWKNLLFAIILFSLILLQVSFWAINLGYARENQNQPQQQQQPAEQQQDQPADADQQQTTQTPQDEIDQTAQQIVEEPNSVVTPAEPQTETQVEPAFGIKLDNLVVLVNFLNFILILAAVIYSLSLMFSLKISLIGRLGGINQIARAFFLSLLMLVFLLPWQKLFPGIVTGYIFTPAEIIEAHQTVQLDDSIFTMVLYYLRFTGYWLLVFILLIMAQVKSSAWARATLRRLEVIE